MSQTNTTDPRLTEIITWLEHIFATTDFQIALASSDASFRRYFRVTIQDKTFILMDAPPQQEDLGSFIKVARFLQQHKVNVPIISAQNNAAGLLLLTDFGQYCYLDKLNQYTADRLYHAAIDSLLNMQLTDPNHAQLASYDQILLQQELMLFPEWFLAKHLSITPPSFLQSTFDLLIANAVAQPQVFVHHDYHSRNLMDPANNSPGIIDFQDAVIGPISYDLVSLLRDCYIQWSDSKQMDWLNYYYQQAVKAQLLSEISINDFIKWFDWMGLQRHLKVLGIFARLNYRDNKANYMDDIPLTLHYVRKICGKYPEFQQLDHFLQQQTKIAQIL